MGEAILLQNRIPGMVESSVVAAWRAVPGKGGGPGGEKKNQQYETMISTFGAGRKENRSRGEPIGVGYLNFKNLGDTQRLRTASGDKPKKKKKNLKKDGGKKRGMSWTQNQTRSAEHILPPLRVASQFLLNF